MRKDVCIVIPAYNPDDNLSALINALKDYNILVVNDGSTNGFDFTILSGIKLLCHKYNKGKGEALKTAFKYIKEQTDYKFVVTADADGQHTTEDIKRVIEELKEDKFILGCREFDKNTPLRSFVGNKITSIILKLFYNISISDSQTGLRGFANNILEELIKIQGSRYEYETAVLLKIRELNLEIVELPICTIYCDNNYCSHFNPLKDSAKIFLQILWRKLC